MYGKSPVVSEGSDYRPSTGGMDRVRMPHPIFDQVGSDGIAPLDRICTKILHPMQLLH